MAEGLSDTELGQALWSVYQHSMSRGGYGASPFVEPLAPQPLHDALQIIRNRDDDHARSRKRRVVVKLTASDLYRAESLGHLLPDDQSEKARGLLVAMSDELGLDPAELDAAKPEVAARMVASKGSEDPTKVVPISCTACLDAMTMRIKVTASALVGRDFAGLSVSLDPQSWDACSESVFVETRKEIEDDEGDWIPDPNPPQPGTTWPQGGYGYVYENVQAGAAKIENRLYVKVVSEPDKIRCDFWLADSISTKIGGLPPEDGGMVKDEGFLECVPRLVDPGWSLVTMEKTVQFTSLAMNYLAAPALCMWLEEATQVVPHC